MKCGAERERKPQLNFIVDRVNFKKNEKTYDAEKSAVFKVLQEEQNDPEPGKRDYTDNYSYLEMQYSCVILFCKVAQLLIYLYIFHFKISES